MIARSLRLHAFDGPSALRLEGIPLDAPGPHEVLVRVAAAPIHPADLNVLDGRYGQLSELPCTPGIEGAGTVIAIGSDVVRCVVGDRVSILAPGNWCSARVVHESQVICIPSDLPDPLAAMLLVNPLTAWAMLQLAGSCDGRGRTVVQNAANSAVGRCVIQIARERDWPSLNLVRRPELVDELSGLGGSFVFSCEDELATHAATLTAAERPVLALNAVGGSSALTLANALADGGLHVTYGAMARQPLKIPNGLLIFRDLQFRGFWLRHWLARNPISARDAALDEIIEWMRSGRLEIPVDREFALDEFVDACTAASESRRPGKVLLRCC